MIRDVKDDIMMTCLQEADFATNKMYVRKGVLETGVIKCHLFSFVGDRNMQMYVKILWANSALFWVCFMTLAALAC